jgi:hypothetical protein
MSVDPRTRRAFVLMALTSGLLSALGSEEAEARVRVPWFGQKSSSDCGRAVLASLAARRGGNPESYYNRLPEPSDPRGYSIAEMRRFGARVGVSLTTTAPSGVVIAGQCGASPAVNRHMDRLQRVVRGGRPAVVPVSGFGFSSGHYLILVGADANGFSVLDPRSPGVRTYGKAELANWMCSYGFVALLA